MANSELLHQVPSRDEEANRFEQRLRRELTEQHRKLQLKARAIFAALKGRPGIRSEEHLAQILAKVTGDYESGKFLLEQLGAHRFIDYEHTVTLGHLREQLLAQIERPTMPDKLAADSAIIAYHNILRVQAWIGNISLVVERDLFGQTPLDQIHGPTVGEKLSEVLRRLELQIFPLLDRAHRMLIRSLNFLERRGFGQSPAAVNVGRAAQVNVASLVANPHAPASRLSSDIPAYSSPVEPSRPT